MTGSLLSLGVKSPSVRDVVLVLIAGFLVIYHGLPAIGALAQGGTSAPSPAAVLGSTFTYQGKLELNGAPAEGSHDFEFSLWDTAEDGNKLGSQQATLLVVNGIFAAPLDFGAGALTGEKRWLEVRVRQGAADFETLGRQELTASPYALFATSAPWKGLTGVPATFADGVDNDTIYTPGPGLQLNGTQFRVEFAGSGSNFTSARSDHDHFGQEWSGGSPTVSGLFVDNQSGTAVHGRSGFSNGMLGYRGNIGVLGGVGPGFCGVIPLSSIVAGVHGASCTTASGVDGFSHLGFSVYGESFTNDSIVGKGGPGKAGVVGLSRNGQNSNWGGFFVGNVGILGSSSFASDARLKRDVADLEDGLAGVRQLRPVTFEWEVSEDAGRHMGFLAQDVRVLYPELVSEGNDGQLMLNYNGLIAVLVRALQEQQAQIDALTIGALGANLRQPED